MSDTAQSIVGVFFQPARNIPAFADMGVNLFFGPEVENAKAISPDALAAGKAAWIKATQDAGAKCIIKNPSGPLPANCAGVLMQMDEPNGKGVLPAAMKAESDKLKADYPGVSIWLSLAGDKILSANFDKPAEKQLYLDYAALATHFTVDFYPRNRNADRYPDTYPGDAAAKLSTLIGKPVLTWLECNDQQLAAPPPGQGSNRAPTPAEIKTQADYAIGKGAMIGWFVTCDSAKYGWPASYFPQVDRAGVSMAPQIAMMGDVSRAITKPTSTPAPVEGHIVAYAWQQPHPALQVMAHLYMPSAADDAHIAGVAAAIKAQPAGKRVLIVQNDYDDVWKSQKTGNEGWVDVVANGPFNVDAHTAGIRKAFQQLNILDAVPDRIILDNEGYPSVWQLNTDMPALFSALYADKTARSRLLPACDYSPADFVWGSANFRQAYTDFNKVMGTRHLAVVRLTIQTASQAFGRSIPFTNFGEVPAGNIDQNGWPVGGVLVDKTYSPVLYATAGGNLVRRADHPELKKSERWNQFILSINWLRSCVNSKQPVQPWIAWPSYDGDKNNADPFLWCEIVKHIAASGVPEVLLWNPSADVDAQSKFAASFLASVKVATPKLPLPMIPLDADEVVTGDVRTKYSSFK